jgi:hypothetical protein
MINNITNSIGLALKDYKSFLTLVIIVLKIFYFFDLSYQCIQISKMIKSATIRNQLPSAKSPA